MARSSFISHTVNGYSRYDVPESKAFTCTPGILYPARIDFINARDRVTIAQGIDVRSNPLAVPSFNPYTVRLHRFWVPLQLYHPELRTNSSKFDMNNLSLNWLPICRYFTSATGLDANHIPFQNSLMPWLRNVYNIRGGSDELLEFSQSGVSLSNAQLAAAGQGVWSNADTYLAYWDIVRNYYSYSQWGLYSIAWPTTWAFTFGRYDAEGSTPSAYYFRYGDYTNQERRVAAFFNQRFCNLEYLDAFYESQFYPNAVISSNNTYNRSNLFTQIVASDLTGGSQSFSPASSNGFPVRSFFPSSSYQVSSAPDNQFSFTAGNSTMQFMSVFLLAHPMAVVPSNPDRFSRLLPPGDSSSDVSMSSVSTIPQLAIASRLQEYKDLLGAGGNRFSDWLETFFASKIEHVDRPKLLFSASQTVNVQVVMNQGGYNNFDYTTGGAVNGMGQSPLGQMGGSICFNTQLGRKQSYYFREPGYMIDMLSIRPVYYWCGVRPDYTDYVGADYFNPVYNDIGYQTLAPTRLTYVQMSPSYPYSQSAYREPCFNEFRSSYDEVLGGLSAISGHFLTDAKESPALYSFWVQQRLNYSGFGYTSLFVDMSTVNSPFSSNVEDNFFVNLSYAVTKKSLVNKTFATRLSNR